MLWTATLAASVSAAAAILLRNSSYDELHSPPPSIAHSTPRPPPLANKGVSTAASGVTQMSGGRVRGGVVSHENVARRRPAVCSAEAGRAAKGKTTIAGNRRMK